MSFLTNTNTRTVSTLNLIIRSTFLVFQIIAFISNKNYSPRVILSKGQCTCNYLFFSRDLTVLVETVKTTRGYKKNYKSYPIIIIS